MLRLLFRPEVNLALSIIMFLGGVFLTVGRMLGFIGQNEPALVFHMSAWALIVSGYGNILVSVVRQEAANAESRSPVQEAEHIILPGDDWVTRHKH
jgi:hypothetical protein